MTQLSLMQRTSSAAPIRRPAPGCLPLDHSTEIQAREPDGIAVAVAIGSGTVQYRVGEHWTDQDNFYAGSIMVAAPGHRARIRWRSSPEGVVLFAANDPSMSAQPSLLERLSPGAMLQFQLEPVTLRLARALLTARSDAAGGDFEQHMAEAIITRVTSLASGSAQPVRQHCNALPSWRLRRVVDMVSDRLSHTVSLADMASAAGLSAMHFAAQFRTATGLRPHDYLLTQRIQKAKCLMKNPNVPLYDIAISVGFRTQAHFTTVFKKLENMTPDRWRRNHMSLAAAASAR